MAEEIDVTTTPLGTGGTYRSTGESGTEELNRLKEKAKERSRGIATEQKGKTAQMLDDLASALHASARQLNEQTHPTPAHYLDRAAENLEKFSSSLRQRDIEIVLRDVKEFAKRQPVALVAGAVVAGVVIARLLKSGSEAGEMEEKRFSAEVPPVETSEIVVH